MAGFQLNPGTDQLEAGFGFLGRHRTVSWIDGLVALASGGQTGAPQMTSMINRIATVATAGDSVMLPPAGRYQGIKNLVVINDGAQVVNIFPGSGDQIGGLGVNAAYALAPGGIANFTLVNGPAGHPWKVTGSGVGVAGQAYNAVANTTGFTLTGAQITGGSTLVTLDLTGTLAGNANVQLPTVAQLVAAMQAAGLNPVVGATYELDITERSAANTWTVTTNTGWTLTGTMTLGTNGFTRTCIVTLNSLTAATLKSIGSYTLGAA